MPICGLLAIDHWWPLHGDMMTDSVPWSTPGDLLTKCYRLHDQWHKAYGVVADEQKHYEDHDTWWDSWWMVITHYSIRRLGKWYTVHIESGLLVKYIPFYHLLLYEATNYKCCGKIIKMIYFEKLTKWTFSMIWQSYWPVVYEKNMKLHFWTFLRSSLRIERDIVGCVEDDVVITLMSIYGVLGR